MEKCRICLNFRKNLRSIYETDDSNLSFEDMIIAVANVMILKEDDITANICLSCRKKLKDAYDFRDLIQKSDKVLRETNGMKRINFHNINELKIEIEIMGNDKKNILRPSNDIFETYFKDGITSVNYRNTIIKRINGEFTHDNAVGRKEPINVMEFLKTFKAEDDSHDYYNDVDIQQYDTDKSEDYELSQPLMLRKKNKSKRKAKEDEDDDYEPSKTLHYRKRRNKKSKTVNKDAGSKFIPIKPVFLEDIRVKSSVRTKVKQFKPKKYNRIKKGICPYCGKIMTSLKQHMLLHTEERKFKCDKCFKGFITEKSLEYHKRIHSEIRDFKCDKCIAAFNNKGSLKSHMARHTDVKNYLCDICNKAFKRRTALLRHIMIHNTNNKTYHCELCNMSFNSTYGLKHHMRVHTGERPYKCEICSQPYSYKHDFNRHCFKKHGIFLKRRSVYVMNEEVLKRERILMRDLMLRVHGVTKDDKPLNPFKGPQGALAFEQAVKALEAGQIPVDSLVAF